MKHHDRIKALASYGMRSKVLHLADGGAVSPFSFRGMANAVGSAANAVTAPFRPPPGYVPAMAAPAPAVAAPAAPVAASPVQLGGMNLSAMQRREAAAGLRDGGQPRMRASPGMVHGPGSTTSDSVPVDLSKHEYVLPADTTAHVGKENLDALVAATHTPVAVQHGMRAPTHLANGGQPVDPRTLQATQGVPNGQDQTAVAGAGPANSGGATGDFSGGPGMRSFAGSQGGTFRPDSVGDNLRSGASAVGDAFHGAMPGTTATLRGVGDDMSDAANQGKYVKAAFTGLRGATALPIAMADDVIGGAGRGAYNMLRNPAEDAGRAVFGMADRPQTAAPAGPPIVGGGSGLRMDGSHDPRSLGPVGTVASQGGGAAPDQSQGIDLGGGMRRFDGGSTPLFSNAGADDNARLMGRGAPSAQNLDAMGHSGNALLGIAPTGIQGRQDLHDLAAANKFQSDKEAADATATNNAAPTPNDGYGLRSKASMAAFNAGGSGGMSPGDKRRATELQIAEAGNRVSMRGQDLSHDAAVVGHNVQARGQDLNYGSAMAGHNVAAEGHVLSAQGMRARMNYDFNKDQRDFSAGRSDKGFEQEREGQKQFADRVGSMFTDPSTGKPDTAKAAEYTQFATNGVADMKAALTKAGRTADANKLSLGRLDDADHALIARQWANREAAKSASGPIPSMGGFQDSLHPEHWNERGIDSRAIGGDHVVFNNGSHASVNDLTQQKWYVPGVQGTSNMNETVRRARAAGQVK